MNIGALQRLIWPLFILKLVSLFFSYYKDFQNKNQIFHFPNNNNNFQFYNCNFPQNISSIFNLREKERVNTFWCVRAWTLFLFFFLPFHLDKLTQKQYGCTCDSSSFHYFLAQTSIISAQNIISLKIR